MAPVVHPKIKSPKLSFECQTSFESIESNQTMMSRRSSTDTILASPKIVGSEDFSIDLSTDSLKVEIGERKKSEETTKVSEKQIILDQMFEKQPSVVTERSIESPRPISVASSIDTVVASPKKKSFDLFTYEQIAPPLPVADSSQVRYYLS